MSKTYMRTQNGEVFETSNPEYHTDCENLGHGNRGYTARQAYVREYMRSFIKPGSTIYYNVNSVSSSGMSRNISFYVALLDEDDKPYIRKIDHLMSDVCGIREGNKGGLVFGGCGMNMGFSGVYSLGRALYPDGFGTIGKDAMGRVIRPLTKKKAEKARERGFVFRGRNGDPSGWDDDGGYALACSSL
jgi:hypothetical protein